MEIVIGRRHPYNASMPPDTKRELLSIIIMISAIGLVLIVTTILLMSAWRRHLARNKAKADRGRDHTHDEPDIWKAGGQRLLNELTDSGAMDLGDSEDESTGPGDPDEYDDGYPREEPF